MVYDDIIARAWILTLKDRNQLVLKSMQLVVYQKPRQKKNLDRMSHEGKDLLVSYKACWGW